MKGLIILIFSCLLLLCSTTSVVVGFKVLVPKPSACSLATNSSGIIDLSNIDVKGSGYEISGPDPNWKFYLNICGSVNNPNNNLCTIPSQAYQYSRLYSLCYSIGEEGVPQLSLLNSDYESAGVVVSHSGVIGADGVRRKLVIYLTCDKSADEKPILNFIGERKEGNNMVYGFAGKTKLACPVRRS